MTDAFTRGDFQIFEIGEFGHQIGTMRAEVTPKLEAWGEALTDQMSELVGEEMYAHVASTCVGEPPRRPRPGSHSAPTNVDTRRTRCSGWPPAPPACRHG